jgi:hypothetical protein
MLKILSISWNPIKGRLKTARLNIRFAWISRLFHFLKVQSHKISLATFLVRLDRSRSWEWSLLVFKIFGRYFNFIFNVQFVTR